MTEYQFRGEIKLSGVWFTVSAETLEQARERAGAGEWDYYETDSAETVDWEVYPKEYLND